MKVRDLMRDHVLSLQPEDSLALAVQLMAWNGLRHLTVKSGHRLVGLLSERDLIARREGEGRLLGTVAEAMVRDPETIEPMAEIEEAAARMAVSKHGCLPVIEADRLVGILTTTDLLAEMAQVHLEAPSQGGLLDRDVESVMTAKVSAVFEDDHLIDAAARMHQYGIRHLPVVDGVRRVVGVLSERDLLKTLGDLRHTVEEEPGKLEILLVRDAMTPEPRTVQRAAPLAEVAAILAEERFGALPVVDEEGHLQGMVSYVDILRGLRQVG